MRRGPQPTAAEPSDLEKYPRPSVAVDVAVLTVPLPPDEQSAPHLLVIRRHVRHLPGRWSLPGTFLRPGEVLAASVTRCLKDKAGVSGLRPRQLQVFDDPRRDTRGWVLAVGHVDVVPWCTISPAETDDVRLVPVHEQGARLPDGQEHLPFDHDQIVRLALDDLRRRYTEHPDPDRLLPEEFTVRELRLVHQAVQRRPLLKDSFRRLMANHLQDTGRRTEGTVGKPARLYERTEPRSDRD